MTLYNETTSVLSIEEPIDVSVEVSGSDIVLNWTNKTTDTSTFINILRSTDGGESFTVIAESLSHDTTTYTDVGAASFELPIYKVQVASNDIADETGESGVITQEPTNLAVSEEIPVVDIEFTNGTEIDDYHTLIYRNQQNRLQGADATNRDNYNIVGAVSSSDGTEIRVSSEPNQSEPSDIQTVHNNLDGSGTSSDPYIITNDYELQSISVDTAAFYTLGIDIDATETPNWNGGSGFNPINTFTGTLDGDGFEVFGLFVSRGGGSAALCSSLGSGGVVKNIGIKNANISGSKNGSDFGSDTIHVGGIVANNSGTIQNVELTGSVTGSLNKRRSSGANGSVDTGGLVGINSGSIIDSYSIAAVDGSIDGFKSIDSSYNNDVGGDVGENSGGAVTTSYSAGAVTGNINTSGSIGVSATNSLGGLVGENTGSVVDSYWDTQASGQSTSAGGIGLTTSEMQGASAETNMSGFDFTNSWETISADYPELIVDKEDETIDQYLFEDYGTDYQTSYSYITNVVTANVFGYSDERSTDTNRNPFENTNTFEWGENWESEGWSEEEHLTDEFTEADVDTFDWEERWGSVNWSQEEISPLDTQDASTIDLTVEEWDTNVWGLGWETAESVEDEPTQNKSGYKLVWSTREDYEDVHFIYRSQSPGLIKDDYDLVGATTDNFFFDYGVTFEQEYYYRIGYVDIEEESASSNTATITTGIPQITDTPILTTTTITDILATDSSNVLDEASIQQVSSSQLTLVDESVAHEPAFRTQIVASIRETPSIATTLEEGTLTGGEISLLQEEFASSVDDGTLQPIEETTVTQDEQSVAFEIERVTDAFITPSVTTESSTVLESPSLVSVSANGIQSTDIVEITNAVTEVTSATATVSAIASGDEQTLAGDAASTQSGEATPSPSDEFSSNEDGGQLTPAAATASPTPSLSAVTDGGVTVAESTPSLTPSDSRASEDAGIAAPILTSTVESTETSSANDESLVTGEFNTTVAPVVEALARDTPLNTDALISPIEVNASASAINTPLVTQFTSQVAQIDAFAEAISARQLTVLSGIPITSTEVSASIDESEIAPVTVADIFADDTATTEDTGLTAILAAPEPSLDEFTQEFNAGTRVTQNVQTISSTEQASAAELAIPETVDVFTFTTASDGTGVSASDAALVSVTDIQSTEFTRAQEVSIPETLTSSPILVDAFTQSFEEDDITVEKASTSLATTDSLEDSASFSPINSTTSNVSTLSVEDGFSSATDRGSIIAEAEKSIISSEEVSTALDEGSITDSSIVTQQSTEFTSSVDEATLTSTFATPIISPDEFASTFEEGSRTTQAVQPLTEDAFTFSIEADRIQEFTSASRETPSVGIARDAGIQELIVSSLLVDAFTFAIDGTVRTQTVTPFEINALTSAFEEGTITPSAIVTQPNDAFTLSNEFNIEQTVDATVEQIDAQTSAVTEGLSVTEAAALTFDEFTSAEEEPLVTDVVATAGTVAENILFGDTAIARDAAGDEDIESLPLSEDAETIAHEQPLVTEMAASVPLIDAATFAEEEGSITTSDAISSDTPSRAISREDNRETSATYDTFEVTAVTSAVEEGTRTLTDGIPFVIDADTSALEEGSITENVANALLTPSVGVTLEEGVITDTEIDIPVSFESLTPVKDITPITSETGTTSLTTRDPEITRAFERARQPDLTATPIVSADEETSATAKKAVLPVIMEDVVNDEFTSAGDTPLVESMIAQTFGDGQAVVNQDLDELDLTTMAATIPQAGVGINPVVSPAGALFDTFQSEETFVITSFLSEPRIVAFSKQEDPLDAGAVRAPSTESTEESASDVDIDNNQTAVKVNQDLTELEVINNGI